MDISSIPLLVVEEARQKEAAKLTEKLISLDGDSDQEESLSLLLETIAESLDVDDYPSYEDYLASKSLYYDTPALLEIINDLEFKNILVDIKMIYEDI